MKQFTIQLAILFLAFVFVNSSNAETCPTSKIVRMKKVTFERQIISKKEPAPPAGCKCSGKIVASIIVNRDGKVASVVIRNGNPLLRVAVTRAINEWRFKPYSRTRKALCYKGFASFLF